jgi:hypothetical protein
MDLEETEVMNDCAGEDQQQFSLGAIYLPIECICRVLYDSQIVHIIITEIMSVFCEVGTEYLIVN